MGSWWNIEIGGRAAPIWGKNYVGDDLMLLFNDDDFHVSAAKLEALEDDEPSSIDTDDPSASRRTDLMGYSSNAGALRQRLQLQGFSTQWVRRLTAAYFDDQEDEWRDEGGNLRGLFPNGDAIAAALATRSGMRAGAGIPPDRRTQPREAFLHEKWGELHEAFDDPRFALALSLSNARSATRVELDLTDLVLGGWMEASETPHREARLRMAAAVGADGPVIVITEGASDARRLQRSIEISSPHVAHVFTFLDFDLRPPGGTDRVVSLTKGMAAAGVMNRVIAVLDNDTAGRDAKAQLAGLQLPLQVVVICLPEVSYAKNYPTLGPTGDGVENVNGRAVSMEFMFGEKVLRDNTGSLAPVRWHAFNERIGEYQGHLAPGHKTDVNNKIDAALSSTAERALPSQIAEGCARLAAALIGAATPAPRIPASEESVLSATWRRNPFAEMQLGD
ncbi:hypothetical protein GCM10007382_23380 [Salinibacterium xinjiangense]|uniref:HEPN/Toprim N-terminal domain-containing protein n=1 Tax=Salinibacterium xinjiangense TaxID=386302 RepID=A0A2C8ZVU9_9MICO|nr:HEPN/Toprim-associated domain-containing protein [Salinibacterium xinjiangense]GGL02826.1 hypothetical protein GCM10007382_23380 [Salinibacterium xinjiangense]SOE69900.1 hypothetical protein SAMN06296378_2087 [Salinibacterium xinjiangense]